MGEAFDKTAKILGFTFPGGPKIEQYAKKGNQKKFILPKPIINRGGCNLSFAGLKTAVFKSSKLIKVKQDKYDLAASFQRTVIDIIYKKTKFAINEFKKYYRGNKIVLQVVWLQIKKLEKQLIKYALKKILKPFFQI